jgi:predicted nucleotidyltransferase
LDTGKLVKILLKSSQPYPILFATVSGAHLYGFDSEDSDFDLRGAHVAPAGQVMSLAPPRETLEVMEMHNGLELDLVTHDVKKYFQLLLKRNGYVLEQVFSPLVVASLPEFKELRHIASSCITKWHGKHFLGFAYGEYKKFFVNGKTTVKRLLYLFRTILVGIHLMRTGRVESNLITLNQAHNLAYLDDLIEQKRSGHEKIEASLDQAGFYEKEYHRLKTMLEKAMESSHLPEKAQCAPMLDDLLIRLRMAGI